MGKGHINPCPPRQAPVRPPHHPRYLRESEVMSITLTRALPKRGEKTKECWRGPYPKEYWRGPDPCRINFRRWNNPIRLRGVPNRYAVIVMIWRKPLDGGRYGDPYEYQVWVVPHFPGKDAFNQIPFEVAVTNSTTGRGTEWVTVAEDLPYKEACEFRSTYFQFIQ